MGADMLAVEPAEVLRAARLIGQDVEDVVEALQAAQRVQGRQRAQAFPTRPAVGTGVGEADMEVFLRRLPIGQLRLLLEARQRHALGVELERGRGKRVQQQQVVMRGGVALIVLDREKLLRAITGGGVEVDPPQLLQGIDRETVRVSVREHVNLLESLRDVGVRGDQRQPHLLGEPPRVLDLPRILAAPVDERPDIVQHQMRQRKAGTGRAGVVLDDVEGIDAAGDARAHPARVRHRRVVHRRLDARLVQHLAVARQGGDQVGADLVEQARGHGGLADDVQPLALGEVQQPDEEGVRAPRQTCCRS